MGHVALAMPESEVVAESGPVAPAAGSGRLGELHGFRAAFHANGSSDENDKPSSSGALHAIVAARLKRSP
jgi:hypothetical protein